MNKSEEVPPSLDTCCPHQDSPCKREEVVGELRLRQKLDENFH